VRTGPRWGARGVTYRRQVILVLLLVAVVPLAVFGVAALFSVEDVVGEEALGQARTAVRGVAAVLGRDAADLGESADSYATWPVLQDEVAASNLEAVRRDVIQFQVDQGEADVVVLVLGDRDAVGGPGSAAAALLRLAETALSRVGGPPTGPTYADLGDGVYLVSVRPIDLSGRTGPGVDAAARGSVGLAFARRLDPTFVVDARGVTGFDGAVFDRTGLLRVASDEAAAQVFAPSIVGTPGEPTAELRGGLVGGSMTLTDLDGRPVGWYVATMRIEGIRTVVSRLIPLLAVGLLLAVLAAAILAILLGRRLRLRLDAIEGGLSAMAAGDLAVRLPADDRDEIGRLATTLDRMGDTLARRDRILREAILAASELTPDLGVERVELNGVAAAARIFELGDCRLEDVGGTIAMASGRPGARDPDGSGPADAPAGRVVTAELRPTGAADGSDVLRLVGRLPAGHDWSEADQSLLDVYVRLLRAAIDDSAVHARTLDRVDRLGRLTRLQGDFLRGVSHNLQAPLTNIVVVADELATAERTDAHAREGVAVIRAEADRLARLVGQLLTLSRLEAGTLRVEAEPVAPAPIIRRVWASLRSVRPFKLDDRSDGMVAVADRAALEQIAWMLLDNALKYAPSGAIGVSLEPADGDERIAITVWDEGPGIVPEERARVFRRFERGSTSEGLEGTGLGLDVARGLVRAMGGSIRYVPAPNGGAGFRFTVPGERSDRPA
jgi:signal transduction histidine kinase/HAMP domain-containing protein